MKKSTIKKSIICLMTAIVMSMSMVACGKAGNSTEKKDNSTSNTEQKSFEKKKVELKYAKGFSIEYVADGVTKVVDGENRTIIIAKDGKSVPEEYKNETIINAPVKKVFIASTTQACSLRAIGELNSIAATTSDAKTWQIPEVKKAIEDGKIQFVGGEKPDYEKLATIKPDLTIVYTGTYGQKDLIAKLEELKLNYVVDNEYMEDNPYGRMEWTKLIAAFYGKVDVAEKHFDGIIKKVEETAKKIEGESKPKIAWASVYKGIAYIPAKGTYVDKMIELAGGENLFKDADTSGQISIEQLFEKAKDADILVYSSTESYTPDKKTILDAAPVLKDAKPIKDNKVWVLGNDYWQSIDKTDEVIVDLMEILHPGKTGESARHFVKLEK